jgi:hypothetical protein
VGDLAGTLLALGGRDGGPALPTAVPARLAALPGIAHDWLQGIDPAVLGGRGPRAAAAGRRAQPTAGPEGIASAAVEDYFARAVDNAASANG